MYLFNIILTNNIFNYSTCLLFQGAMNLLHNVDIPVEKATFGMGCFWGVDSLFGGKNGVIRTKVGYGGGKMANPTYYNM